MITTPALHNSPPTFTYHNQFAIPKDSPPMFTSHTQSTIPQGNKLKHDQLARAASVSGICYFSLPLLSYFNNSPDSGQNRHSHHKDTILQAAGAVV
mmetsp:Transcript_6769/g.18165  ORF Transcript_6769/g.18165 Transcript_6769/m.18165 type:complete len:96 (-) Transcript_6769:1522-1809(-)